MPTAAVMPETTTAADAPSPKQALADAALARASRKERRSSLQRIGTGKMSVRKRNSHASFNDDAASTYRDDGTAASIRSSTVSKGSKLSSLFSRSNSAHLDTNGKANGTTPRDDALDADLSTLPIRPRTPSTSSRNATSKTIGKIFRRSSRSTAPSRVSDIDAADDAAPPPSLPVSANGHAPNADDAQPAKAEDVPAPATTAVEQGKLDVPLSASPTDIRDQDAAAPDSPVREGLGFAENGESDSSSEDEFFEAYEADLAAIAEDEEDDDVASPSTAAAAARSAPAANITDHAGRASPEPSNETDLEGIRARNPELAKALEGIPTEDLFKAVSEKAKEQTGKAFRLTFQDVVQSEDEMNADLGEAKKAMDLFLNSRMLEAESICIRHASSQLYYSVGYALIQFIKSLMTFEPADLHQAIDHAKDSLHISSLLRKHVGSISSVTRFVRGTGPSPSAMAGMTRVQRHAELIYGESLLLKAVVGIAYSGDFFAFVKEALNMRNAYGIYRSLAKYVEWADAQAVKRGDPRDLSLDEDFRSGVYLGNGLISMILGLLPGKVLKVMEVFGYTGDKVYALNTLAKAADWSHDPDEREPGVEPENEGVRRQICDLAILLYHLLFWTYLPLSNPSVDIDFADKVLHYNLRRYPKGIFFLYFSGRLYSSQCLAEKAINQFQTALGAQKEYLQLQHICQWDIVLCRLGLCDFKEAYKGLTILRAESNWSKAVYTYGMACSLYEMGEDPKKAAELFASVQDAMRRIGGKSIPAEKYVARKARKFQKQGRLIIPGIEFSYLYHCLSMAPRWSLAENTLVRISDALAELHAVEDPETYGKDADEYWDDFALCHFMRAVTLKYIAYPEPHAKVNPPESPIPIEEATEQALLSLENVMKNGGKIKHDHWLVYFAHYELGRLYAAMGEDEKAAEQFELVLSQKPLEDRGRKGKYSLQNMCLLRSNGALDSLKTKEGQGNGRPAH